MSGEWLWPVLVSVSVWLLAALQQWTGSGCGPVSSLDTLQRQSWWAGDTDRSHHAHTASRHAHLDTSTSKISTTGSSSNIVLALTVRKYKICGDVTWCVTQKLKRPLIIVIFLGEKFRTIAGWWFVIVLHLFISSGGSCEQLCRWHGNLGAWNSI